MKLYMIYHVYMEALVPVISVSELQRHPRKVLDAIEGYAVIRSHGHDLGMVMHPRLAKVLLRSGKLRELLEMSSPEAKVSLEDVDRLVGKVIRALSRK